MILTTEESYAVLRALGHAIEKNQRELEMLTTQREELVRAFDGQADMHRTRMAEALGMTRGRIWQIINADRPEREQIWKDDQVILDPELYAALVEVLDIDITHGESLVNPDAVKSV